MGRSRKAAGANRGNSADTPSPEGKKPSGKEGQRQLNVPIPAALYTKLLMAVAATEHKEIGLYVRDVLARAVHDDMADVKRIADGPDE